MSTKAAKNDDTKNDFNARTRIYFILCCLTDQ